MAPVKSVQEYFEKVIVPTIRTLFMGMFGPVPPELPPSADGPPPPSGHPYRTENETPKPPAVAAPEPRVAVTCVTQGEGSRTKEVVEKIKEKTKRRAIRYFENLRTPGKHKEVRHRVTDRKPGEIEFSYFRRAGNPLKVRWHLEPHAEIQDQK